MPLVVAETAKPEKFPEAIERAIPGIEIKMPDVWKNLDSLPEKIHDVPADAEEVQRFIMKIAA